MQNVQNEVMVAMQRINNEIIRLVGLAVSVTVPAPPASTASSFDREELFKNNKSVLVVQYPEQFHKLNGPLISSFIVTGKVAGKAKHAEAFACREDADAAAEKMDSCSIWSADVKMAQGSLWGRKPYAYTATKKLLFRRKGQKVVFEEEFYSLA